MFKRLQRSWRSSRIRSFTRDWLLPETWLRLLPFWLTPEFYWEIISYPFRWFLAAWHERTLRSFLWGLPALAMIFCLALVFHRLRLQSQSISYIYWENAQAAIDAGDYSGAEMLLDRILQEGTAHVSDARYGLAMVYGATGRGDRAALLFNALAPDDGRGHAEAHRRLALLLAESLSDATPPENLRRLKHHLDAAGDQDSPDMILARGKYSLATGDFPSALKYFEKVAVQFPEVWITIGEIQTAMGNAQSATASYRKASEFLRKESRSSDSATDINLRRQQYGTVLTRLELFDEARIVYEEALQDDPEGDWHQRLADLYIYYHDYLKKRPESPSEAELLALIAKALEHDPDFAPALVRLMDYVQTSEERKPEIKQLLMRIVSEGKDAALPHLALGNLCWMEQDMNAAVLHFERATEINPKLAVVMNNLAWLLGSPSDYQDLDRALGLVDTALKERPGDPSFLDTRGMILLRSGRPREALNDLEAALPGVRDKAGTHSRIAEAYQELGIPDMAEEHRRREREARGQASSAVPTAGS